MSPACQPVDNFVRLKLVAMPGGNAAAAVFDECTTSQKAQECAESGWGVLEDLRKRKALSVCPCLWQWSVGQPLT